MIEWLICRITYLNSDLKIKTEGHNLQLNIHSQGIAARH